MSIFIARQTFYIVRYQKTVLLLILFAVISFLSWSIFQIENERRLLKEDLIELSKVKYGLFSVDEWKQILANIISKKVEELNFTGQNRIAMRKKISALLYKVIDDYEAQFKEENSGSLKGFLQSAVSDMLGGFSRIRKNIPKFTEQIMNFLNDPQNKKAIRKYIIEKLNEYADNTFAKIDYTAHDEVLKHHHFENRLQAIDGLSIKIEELDNRSKPFKIAILAIVIAATVWVLVSKRFSNFEYLMLIAISFLLLLTGLGLPMIEIDARISKMSFALLGETISFKDQVLYYKSKSILEVVWLMLKQSRIDVLVVGALVFVFSVLFPVVKQLASASFVYVPGLRSDKVIRFMVFKTGKWSMADVMVIAIFMSYIGFSGIISEHLQQIETMATSIEILTTNKSSLLTGFFFFTAFAIFSLSISQKLELQFGSRDIGGLPVDM